MPDLRTDPEAFRDSWLLMAETEGFHDAARITSWLDANVISHLLLAHPAGHDLRAMVNELEAGKKWQNKLLDDIRALEADRDSWKKANERSSQSCAESAAEVEHLRDAMDDAFESGYIQGHNDTVESKYREPADAAEDYRLSLTAHTSPSGPDLREWRGPWKCEKCGKEGSNQWGEMVRENGYHFASDEEPRCTGTLRTYERRKGGA